MHPIVIVALVFCFAGFVVCVTAGILYDPPIQRYLEKLGVAPCCFLYSMSGLRDYLNAKKLAKRWGHKPEFLKRYERLQVLAMTLFAVRVMLMLAAQLAGL
jgi:hypothetical protein